MRKLQEGEDFVFHLHCQDVMAEHALLPPRSLHALATRMLTLQSRFIFFNPPSLVLTQLVLPSCVSPGVRMQHL